MNKTETSVSTTYNSLKSILTKSLEQSIEILTFWLRRKNEEYTCLEEAERDGDRKEANWHRERIGIHENLSTAAMLIQQLLESVEDNPFPGRQMSVLSFAAKALPNVRFRWTMKGKYARGEAAWKLVFEDSRIFDPGCCGYFPNFRVCFPVKAEFADIAEIEKRLLALCREDWTVPAAAVAEVAGVGANTSTYRNVKNKLQERGWVWKHRKVARKMERVVVAPEGVRP